MNRTASVLLTSLLAITVVVGAAFGLTIESPYAAPIVNSLLLLTAAMGVVGACLGARPARAFCLGYLSVLGFLSLAGKSPSLLEGWLIPAGERSPLITDLLINQLCEWKSAYTVGDAVEAIDPSAPLAPPPQFDVWYDGSQGVPAGGSAAPNPYAPINLGGRVYIAPGIVAGDMSYPYGPFDGTLPTYLDPTSVAVYSPGRIGQAKADQYEITWSDGRKGWVPATHVRRDLTIYREQARSVLMLLMALLGGGLSWFAFGRVHHEPTVDTPPPQG